jgi:uncharacterized protein YndB with AHSA1/START domain
MATANIAATEPADRVLVVERIFDAPRDLVFKVWTDPKHLVNWFGPRGFTLPSCEMNLRLGGAWRYCMLSPEGSEHWVQGTFREIVEPERLAFTWAHENPNGTLEHETLVTVTLVDLGGKTKLTLRHAIFESMSARDEHQNGWSSSLERLAEYLAAA